MNTITGNEMLVMLTLFKDFTTSYNANNLSKMINMTSMGTLKILKNLEKKHLVTSKQLGKAIFYKPNFFNSFVKTYLSFLLEKESVDTEPQVKRWIKEFKSLGDYVEIAIVFGSVLSSKKYTDVDILIVLKPSQHKQLNKSLENIQRLTSKNIHIVKQTESDLVANLQKKDKVLLNIIKQGKVVFGNNKLLEVIEYVSR